MGKCVKNLALSVIAAVFGVLALTGPVFATPDTSNTGNPDTTVVTPTTPETTPETTDTTENTENTEETTAVSCYDQVGSLGWIICPGAGLFGNVIDGAYDLLSQIIQVNPIPTDNSSPTYVVWNYFKDITNSLFIVFLLVIILSQLTGFGINNYGIKKALPRIVISAILVNLSYIICTIAVDLSNILGNAFQGFFVNVQNIAIENGTISSTANGASVAAIVAGMLGVGTAGAVFAGAVALGGAGGVIWFLLPVLLSGLLAVISAVVTMAARQALIFLLVMVSPLALIAYTLPNTEKWFQKWYHLLAQMLFFYPMFSILYGASQLAGLVIITSATNWLGVVLGIAVKILPLFLSIPLMRMSGTALGKISGVVNRLGAPVQGAVGRYSMSKQALAKQKQLNKKNPALPSTRLAQYLERRRIQRDFDTKELAAHNLERDRTSAQQAWYRRDGTLNRRGLLHYQNEQAKLDYAVIRTNIASDFDEGFQGDGTDKRVRKRDLTAINVTNARYETSVVDSAFAESRKRVVAYNNMKRRAELIHDHIDKEGDAIHQRALDAFNVDTERFDELKAKDEAYKAVRTKLKKYNGDMSKLTAAERATYNAGGLKDDDRKYFEMGSQAINFTLADAISARRKLDNEATSTYFELYDDSPAGTVPNNALISALENDDKNSMKAAIQVMAKRGDHKDIMDILKDYSGNLKESNDANDPDNANKIRFQKEINDVCLALKPDNQILWAWAKSNMIRRGKYNHAIAEGETPTLKAYIDFDKFISGSVAEGDDIYEKEKDGSYKLDREGNKIISQEFAMVNMEDILTNVRDGKIFGDADRTMYNFFSKNASKGNISTDHYYFTDVKHLRASASCGKMDGEQLASFNNYFTMNYKQVGDTDKDGNQIERFTETAEWKAANELFEKNKTLVHEKIRKYFKDMNAAQLVGLKTATLIQFNDALLALDQIDPAKDSNEQGYVMMGDKKMSKELLSLLEGEINQLNKPSAINQRSGMNIAVREWLGISTGVGDDDDKNKPTKN